MQVPWHPELLAALVAAQQRQRLMQRLRQAQQRRRQQGECAVGTGGAVGQQTGGSAIAESVGSGWHYPDDAAAADPAAAYPAGLASLLLHSGGPVATSSNAQQQQASDEENEIAILAAAAASQPGDTTALGDVELHPVTMARLLKLASKPVFSTQAGAPTEGADGTAAGQLGQPAAAAAAAVAAAGQQDIDASSSSNGAPGPSRHAADGAAVQADDLLIPACLTLVNKQPYWSEVLQAWCLNFHGRVKLASVKNFQLTSPHDPLRRLALQFGKVTRYMKQLHAAARHCGNCIGGVHNNSGVAGADGCPYAACRCPIRRLTQVEADVFAMDYNPCVLTALQAFAICLTAFNRKSTP